MTKLDKTTEIFDFIVEYKRQHQGRSPTIREMGVGTGLSSTNTVLHHVRKLVKQHRIVLDNAKGGARNIVIPGAVWIYDRETTRH